MRALILAASMFAVTPCSFYPSVHAHQLFQSTHQQPERLRRLPHHVRDSSGFDVTYCARQRLSAVLMELTLSSSVQPLLRMLHDRCMRASILGIPG